MRMKMQLAAGLFASVAAASAGALDGRPSVTWERTVDGTAAGGATVYGLTHVFGNAVMATPEAEHAKCTAHRWLDELFPPAGVYCRHNVWAWAGIGETCPAPPNDLQSTQDRIHTNADHVTPREARLGRADAGGGTLPAGRRSCWTARESVGGVASRWATPVWWDVDANGRVVATSGKNPDPVPARHSLPLVVSAPTRGLQSFIRVINHSPEAGTVRIEAIDDDGVRFAPVTLDIKARHVVHFNSKDLEEGNAAKGLSGGVGDGEGHWRLELTTTLDIEPNAYIRTADGFLTSMHDLVAAGGPRRYHVSFFNPGGNRSQVSQLRIANIADTPATVVIDAHDDRGRPGEGTVRLTLGPLAARTVTAQALESGGDGLDGRLGDGAGKWRLHVSADQPIQVMSLLRSPTGHVSNLSSTTTVADRVFPVAACGDPSTVVSIPDPGLRGAVEEALGKATGASITQGELATLDSLTAGPGQIRSLAGLECAIGLTELTLGNHTNYSDFPLHNQVTDISPLAGLTALTTLELGRNLLTDLSPLADLTALTYLDLQGNRITDVSPLAGLTALTELYLGENQLTDISPLAALTGLEGLALDSNQISDLPPLAGLTALTWLELNSNQLMDISPLAALTGLEELELDSNQISDIAPLIRNTGLGSGDYVSLQGNPLSAVSRNTHVPALRARGVEVYVSEEPSACGDPSTVVTIPDAGLRGAVEKALGKATGAAITQGELASLTWLGAFSRDVRSLAGLECAVGLTRLDIRFNQITSLAPLAGLTALGELLLDDNQIADLMPLAGLTGLTELTLSINAVTDLTPLAGLTGLTYLGASSNQITDLTPLAGLTALAGLNLINNQIKDLAPLVRNTGLGDNDEIWLQSNPLSAVSRNTHIPALRARGVTVWVRE